jgi:glycosyltransferase involved in cell wall biosynthesis
MNISYIYTHDRNNRQIGIMNGVGNVSLSVVVPVYKSGQLLHALYDRLAQQLDVLSNDWEIILVDDASPDNSWEVACSLRAKDPRVKAIQFAHNHGQQHATLCGLGYATNDYVVTIDDDLQCFPEDLPLFVDALNSGKRVVIGRISPEKKHHAWWRNIGSQIHQHLAGKILGKPKGLSLSSYRAMTRDVVKRLVLYKGAHPHIAALLLKSVPPAFIGNVDIQHAERGDCGGSSYTLPKLIRTLSFLLINHSFLPLRLMIGWGIVMSIASLAFALWIVAQSFFLDYATPGWASLAVLISFLSGNILLALGIVGEYLGRLVEEASNITQFSIFEERV